MKHAANEASTGPDQSACHSPNGARSPVWRKCSRARAWRDDFASDPDGVASFTRITGRPPTAAPADAAWRDWVLHTH